MLFFCHRVPDVSGSDDASELFSRPEPHGHVIRSIPFLVEHVLVVFPVVGWV